PEPPQEEGLDEPHAGNDNDRPPSRKEAGAHDAADPFGATDAEWREEEHPRAPDGKFGNSGSSSSKSGGAEMPDIPAFLKRDNPASSGRQHLRMPQFGLTPTPWEPHQLSSWKPRKARPEMAASSGDPKSPSGILAVKPGEQLPVRSLNGVSFK